MRSITKQISAALAALVVSVAGCGGQDTLSSPRETGPGPASWPATSGVSPSPSPSTTPSPPAHRSNRAVLRPGDSGRRVEQLQLRLAALGYWLGQPDGNFGYLTEQAVLALQKAAELTRDGSAGPRTMAALATDVRPRSRRTVGTGIEIDLKHQLLLYVRNGSLQWVFNTSTGSGATYWQGGIAHVAATPVGNFTVFREVNAADVSPLGVLWRPKYFSGGVAIHGYPEVPAYPASHGCVRLTNAAMNFLWTAEIAPVGTSVWVY